MITIVTSSVTPIVSLPGSEAGTDVDVEVVVVGEVVSTRVVGGAVVVSGGAVVEVAVPVAVAATDVVEIVTGASA